MLRALALLCVLALSTSVHAELPPGSYDKLRSGADEAVTIQVTKVTLGADGTVGLKAKVLGVERSKGGLKKGDTISITYKGGERKEAGTTPVPLLEQDGVYPAFLNKKGDEFEPAAHGWSFKMTQEAKGCDHQAEKIGKAVQVVDELLKVNPSDPKADELKRAVIGIGTADDGMYRWVTARLNSQQKLLEGEKDNKSAYLTPAEVKDLNARIKFLAQVEIEIHAPK